MGENKVKYESAKTAMGNVGISYVSQAKADAQAVEMDEGGNRGCYNCTNRSNCINCTVCSNCSGCSGCSGCSWCSGALCWIGPKAYALISLNGLKWGIATNGTHIRIGCQQHSVEDWAAFNDEQITEMATGALEFWQQFKPTVMAMVAYRRSLDVKEQA